MSFQAAKVQKNCFMTAFLAKKIAFREKVVPLLVLLHEKVVLLQPRTDNVVTFC